LKSTTNDDFLSGKLIASYDFAVILAEDNVEEEEYEMQREFFEHYLACPISAAFTTYAPLRVPADFKEKFSLCKEITEDMKGREAEVLGLLAGFVAELCAKQAEHESKAKAAFAKFDLDGTGDIDKDELYNLSAELGAPLDEDGLNAALKDLDLNGDGVIDYQEFRRWYYSGMKSYSDRKRSFYKALGGFGAFSKHAANPKVLDFVNENPQTITQSISMGFNPPENAKTSLDVKTMVGGQTYEKVLEEAMQMRKSVFGDKDFGYEHKGGERIMYCNVSLSNNCSDDAFAKLSAIIESFKKTGEFKGINEHGVDFKVTKGNGSINL
jgi:hypothetical protein